SRRSSESSLPEPEPPPALPPCPPPRPWSDGTADLFTPRSATGPPRVHHLAGHDRRSGNGDSVETAHARASKRSANGEWRDCGRIARGSGTACPGGVAIGLGYPGSPPRGDTP